MGLLNRCFRFSFKQLQVPSEIPDESIDLILLSEVGYYWSCDDLLRSRRLIVEHLQPGGQVLLAHSTPYVEDSIH